MATTYVCIVRLPTIGNLNRLPPPFRSGAQREHRGEGRESAGRRAARVQLRGFRVSAGGRHHLVVRPDHRQGRHGGGARGECAVNSELSSLSNPSVPKPATTKETASVKCSELGMYNNL